MNITAVLDWEWSRTVPVQMFVPPTWLTGSNIHNVLGFWSVLYMEDLATFREVVKEKEEEIHCQGRGRGKVPLSKLWERIHKSDNFFIARALLRLDVLGDIYWDGLDRHYFGKDAKARVKLYYEVLATTNQNRVIKKKLKDLEIYNTKLKEQGLEEDKPLKPLPGLPSDIRQELAVFLKDMDVKEATKAQVFWSWSCVRSQVALDWWYILSTFIPRIYRADMIEAIPYPLIF